MSIPLAPAVLFVLLARIYGFIFVCSALSFAHPRLRRPEAKPIRQAINSWWPPALAGGLCVALGAWATLGVFALTSGWTLREFLRTQGAERDARLDALAYATVPLHFGAIATGDARLVSGLWLFWTFGLLTLASLRLGGEKPIARAARVQLGVVWTVFSLGHVPWFFFHGPLPGPSGAAGFVLLLLLSVMTSDAGQYVSGKALGRHKLAPTLSPKKTWEGLAGGMAISALVAGLAAPSITPFTHAQGALLGAALSGLGLLGDLTVSGLKREVGIKDLGTALPGQGGLLDRCDSLILTAPLFFTVVQAWFG